ncbi:unnamed protein product [Gordionus sp. m RMFG-2023]
MSSGVAVDDECLKVYEEDDRKIKVLKKAEANATYDEFLKDLKEAESQGDCRYAIYDFDYKVERHGAPEASTNKLLFYIWCPGSAKIKRKMIYTSSKDAIKKKLVGIGGEIQGTDDAEVSYDEVLEKVKSGERH